MFKRIMQKESKLVNVCITHSIIILTCLPEFDICPLQMASVTCQRGSMIMGGVSGACLV